MKVEMLRDYFGQRKGNKVDLGGGLAELLILRGFARKVRQTKRSHSAGKQKEKKHG